MERPSTYVLPFAPRDGSNAHDPDLLVPIFGFGWYRVDLCAIEPAAIVAFVASCDLMVRKFLVGCRIVVGDTEVPIAHAFAACPLPIEPGDVIRIDIAAIAPEPQPQPPHPSMRLCLHTRLSAVIDDDPRLRACRRVEDRPARGRLLVCPGGFMFDASEAAPIRPPLSVPFRAGRG
jgi:hypothetical protein